MNRSFFTKLPDHSYFLCCRVSARQPSLLPGASRRAQPLLWSNLPKPLTPRPALLHEMDARYGRASQLAALKQGSPDHESVHTEGRTAGVGQGKAEPFRDSHERARSPIFCMIRFLTLPVRKPGFKETSSAELQAMNFSLCNSFDHSAY